ncbi:MAG: arginase [Desulfovibrio sp.]|uniref:arginase n=1 Tax=Desulfovibrio sp. 7SRBS1 TaxID=3378064 RepID=UPI003B3EB02E
MLQHDKSIHILGVPLDLGLSKLGADMGPTALRYAGLYQAFDYAGFKYEDHGDLDVLKNFTLDRLPVQERNKKRFDEIIRVSDQLAHFVNKIASSGGFPLTLGGDHSTSIGSIAGLAKAYERLGVIWIDAHPDANTPDTSPSGNVHGMPLATSLGHGYKELTHCLGFAPKVRYEDVCIVGAKDIDPEELEFLRNHDVCMYTTFDIQDMGIGPVIRQAVERVGKHTDAVYVSFDADAMDMNLAPGTGIMTRGGLGYREISYIMEYIGRNVTLAGVDMIELNPLMDKRNATAELCVELLMSLLGVRYSDYEKSYLPDNQWENGNDE